MRGRRGPSRGRRARTGPAAPPLRWSMHSADQRGGRSHSAAMEQADALRPIAPPAPGPRGPRRRLPGAPGPLGGGTGPVTADRPEPPGRIPAAQGPGADPQPLRPRAANTPQAGPGRARAPRRQPDRAAPQLIGALPGCGRGSSSLHGFRPPTTPRTIHRSTSSSTPLHHHDHGRRPHHYHTSARILMRKTQSQTSCATNSCPRIPR